MYLIRIFFCLWVRGYRTENNASLMRQCLNSFKWKLIIRQSWLECKDCTAPDQIFEQHTIFSSDLTRVKIEYGRRNQIFFLASLAVDRNMSTTQVAVGIHVDIVVSFIWKKQSQPATCCHMVAVETTASHEMWKLKTSSTYLLL